MKITVTIAVYKEIKILRRCLKQLATQEFPFERFEILLCGSNSSPKIQSLVDETLLEYPKLDLRLINTSNNLSCKRNVGVRNAKYQIVTFLDDDCIIEKDYLNKISKLKFRTEDGSPVIYSGEVRFPNAWAKRFNYYRFRDNEGFKFDTSSITLNFRTIVVMNLAFLKSDIQTKSLYCNPAFTGYGMEDQDFGFRAEKLGFKLFSGNFRVIHHEKSRTIEGYGKKVFHTARDGVTNLIKINKDCFHAMPHLKLVDPRYPLTDLRRMFWGFARFIVLSKLMRKGYLVYCRCTDNKRFFYSNFIFRLVLASYYYEGARASAFGVDLEKDWYK